jgi:hypothetical protein
VHHITLPEAIQILGLARACLQSHVDPARSDPLGAQIKLKKRHIEIVNIWLFVIFDRLKILHVGDGERFLAFFKGFPSLRVVLVPNVEIA